MLLTTNPENGRSPRAGSAPAYCVSSSRDSTAGSVLQTSSRCSPAARLAAASNPLALPAPLVSRRAVARRTDTSNALRVAVSANIAYWSFSANATTFALVSCVPPGSAAGPVAARKYDSAVGSSAITPSTCSPLDRCHIAAQIRAAYGKCGLTFESTNVDVGSDGPYSAS